MPITPSDIEHKTFSTALRGYDLDEVDDFLDEIVVALRDLHGELTAARAKIAELEQSKPEEAVGVAVPSGVGDEASVGRVLILAQQAADRTMDDARAEADRLLEEARGEADRTLTEARTEADSFEAEREERRTSAQVEMAELTALVASVRNHLALLATSVADKLDEMDSTIESADVIGGDGDVDGLMSEFFDHGEDLELALDDADDNVEEDAERATDLTALDEDSGEVEDLDALSEETLELGPDAESQEVGVDGESVEDATEEAIGEIADEVDQVEEGTEEGTHEAAEEGTEALTGEVEVEEAGSSD